MKTIKINSILILIGLLLGVFMLGAYTSDVFVCGNSIEVYKWFRVGSVSLIFLVILIQKLRR